MCSPRVGDDVRSDYFDSLADVDAYKTQKPSSRAPVCERPARSQLLVCHDFQGGYSEQKDARGYTFEHWGCTDVFIYFAHKRVSLPPPGWVRAAHQRGTAILGTLIFEWDESKGDLGVLLDGPVPRHLSGIRNAMSHHFADKLIELALERGIQGFLVNVEVPLELFATSNEILRQLDRTHNAERLRRWVEYLRDAGAMVVPDWQVVWYDAVTYPDGRLAWQDSLSPANAPYFQAAGRGFTNYTWAKPENCAQLNDHFHPSLRLSAAVADSMHFPRAHVFVGIDVFGRNCFGGHDTHHSLAMVGAPAEDAPVDGADEGTALGLSVALFAPGWTWEHDAPPERPWSEWWDEDCAFWLRGPHPITHFFPTRAMPWQGNADAGSLGFRTNFALGSGTHWFFGGADVRAVPAAWTDQGVSAPKPDLAWPTPRYVLDEHGAPSSIAVQAALRDDYAWSGNVSLVLTPELPARVCVPLLALASHLPWSGSVTLTLRLSVQTDGPVQLCLVLGPERTVLSGTTHMTKCEHGWQQVMTRLDVPTTRLSASGEVHVCVCVVGAARIGQLEALAHTCATHAAPHESHRPHSEPPEAPCDAEPHEATMADGVLSWPDMAPWCASYEVFLLADEPAWLGTATQHERTRVRIEGALPEGSVLQVRPIGAWPQDPVALAAV